MDYTFVATLEQITLIKIAVTLWNVNDVKKFIPTFYFPLILSIRMDGWQKIENTVVKKVSKLPLPNPLKHKVLCFIRPVGQQILGWFDFQYVCCRFVTKLPSEFFWTSQGTIDKRRMAEVLVNDASLGIYQRYKIACTYCLVDHIVVLWKQLQKDPYMIDVAYIRIHETPLVSFWSHYVEDDIAQLNDIMKDYCDDNVTPYEYAFCRFAESGNEAATRYFLKKLTPEEKQKTLVITTVNVAYKRCNFDYDRTDFPEEYYTDVLCFLLLQLDEEQQIEVFKNHSSWVLKCFLDWPWQSFFMKTAERAWNFLSEEDYYHLLFDITDETFIENRNFNYKELLTEFWQQSPSAHKKYVINQCIMRRGLVSNLFRAGDKENIQLIFKYAIAEEREQFLYGQGRYIWRDLIYDRKLDLLKFFVGEFISSKDIMIRFKAELKTFIARRLPNEVLKKETHMFKRFLQLLEDFIEKYDEKSNVKESDSSSAKILCSLKCEHPSSSEIFKN